MELPLELTAPVELGTPDAFLQWVNAKAGAHIPPMQEIMAQVPAPLKGAIESMLSMKISIEALAVKTGPDGYRRFAASVDFTHSPPRLGSFLELDKVSFRIESGRAPAPSPPATS